MGMFSVYRVLEKEDAIRFEMRLPSGELGFRTCGHPVVVEVTPTLVVNVRSPSSDRILISGAWNLTNVAWNRFDAERELCDTALAMVDAQVRAVVMMFRRRALSATWLDVRARAELGV